MDRIGERTRGGASSGDCGFPSCIGGGGGGGEEEEDFIRDDEFLDIIDHPVGIRGILRH